jgi:hypothetical protein
MKKKSPLWSPMEWVGVQKKKATSSENSAGPPSYHRAIGGVPEDVLFGQNFDLVGEHVRAVDWCEKIVHWNGCEWHGTKGYQTAEEYQREGSDRKTSKERWQCVTLG